jgi:hypothetical protein
MRVFLWIGVVLGVLWGGYWVVGARVIETGANKWVSDMQAQGLAVAQDDIAVAGFPSRFDLTVTRPRIADQVTGWGWKAPFAQVLSMTWKPWHVIAVLPQDQEIDAPGQRIALTTSKMQGSLRLAPSTDQSLAEVVIEAHDVALVSDLGWQVGLTSAVLALGKVGTNGFDQRLGLDISDLRPDATLTAQLPDLGDVISKLHLDSVLALSAALDRHAGATQPRVTGVTVRDFSMIWGSLRLSAKGQVRPGRDGLAEGQIDFAIEDWRQVPALAVALGLVRPEMGQSLTNGLDVLAQSGGNPDVLNLALTFADGWMSLGPIPLGPAPVLN